MMWKLLNRSGLLNKGVDYGAPDCLLVEHATLNLKVVHSNPTLSVGIM